MLQTQIIPVHERHEDMNDCHDFPLFVRAVFGGRCHRPSSQHWSIFHFPLVLSCLPSHLVPIPSITCRVFNPLIPLMSLSEIVWLYVMCMYYVGVQRVLYPLLLFCTFHFFLVLSTFIKHTPFLPSSFSCAWLPCHQHTPFTMITLIFQFCNTHSHANSQLRKREGIK